jgi:hypothetical protein
MGMAAVSSAALLIILVGIFFVGVVLVQLLSVEMTPKNGGAIRITTRTNMTTSLRNNQSVAFIPNDNSTTAVKREERIIYLLHLHKCGGTIMCAAAKLNGLNVNAVHNCNVQEDQQCCGNKDTVQAQQEFALSTKYNFVSNEAEMYTSVDSQHYRYIVSLRKSQDRYKSHWKHVARENDVNFNMTFVEWYQRQPDNWMVRKLCGTPCSDSSKYNITRTEFQYTLKRLHVFQDFIFLETFQESFTKFTQTVGWSSYVPKESSNEDSKPSNYYDSNDNDKWDEHMSVLDNALYDYASQLYNNVTVPKLSKNILNNVELYFSQGPSRGCTTPCCSPECSKYR